MCGLSGLIGDVSMKEEKIFKSLLWVSATRGTDSTGAGSVSRNLSNGERDIKVAKETGHPGWLFDTKSFDKIFYGTNSVMIGHNRSTTVGATSRRNAHPFLFDDILGTHNGTLDYANKGRLEQGNSFPTDSEAIFNNIQVNGIKDTIGRIEESEAYALVWYDRKDHTMNFLRNDKRPLIYCEINKGRTLVWASEYEILMFSLGRLDVKPDEKVWIFPPNMHYSWKIPEFSIDKLPEPKRQRYDNYSWKKKTTVFPSANGGNKNGYDSWKGGNGYGIHRGRINGSDGSPSGVRNPVDLKDDDDWEIAAAMASCGDYSLYTNGYTRRESDKETNIVMNPPAKKTPEEIIAEKKKILEDSKPTEEILVSGITDHFSEATKEQADKTKEENTAGHVSQLTRPMSVDDVIKKKAFEHVEKNGLVPAPKDLVMVNKYFGTNLKVWRNMNDGIWTAIRWDGTRKEWGTYHTKEPPMDLPYTNVDINAKHCFRHVKRGKTKEIYYKGWKTDLDRPRFEKIMTQGCINCNRHPQWGNEVVFISPSHDFLCEWCDLTPSLRKELLTMATEASEVSTAQTKNEAIPTTNEKAA